MDKQHIILKDIELAMTTNFTFLPLYKVKSRYLVLKGGGGSGKSIFAGRKVLERCAENKRHKFLVVRKVARTIRESCFAQIRIQIEDHFDANVFKINKSDMTIMHKNGNMIVFSGLDDVEKLKSIYGITDVWIEEATELTEEDFDQLDIRCREKPSDYSQIILTFNPISILHWLKKRFFDFADDNVTVHESIYKDNRFLTDEAMKVLEKFKYTNPYYYSVYCLNEWGVTGKTVFNAELVSQRLRNIDQVKTYRFNYRQSINCSSGELSISDIELTEDKDGFIRLYKHPQAERYYVIGGDTAGEGSDEFAGQCIDNTSLEQVAVLNQKFDAHEYADQIYCMGMYYNEALLSIETNGAGCYIVQRLAKLGYKNLYVREKTDTFFVGYRQAYGFCTNVRTRRPMIDNLVEIMSSKAGLDTINDKKTLEEMLTFVRGEHGRPEAQAGAHDDHILALGIAHYTRHQQKVYIKKTYAAEYAQFFNKYVHETFGAGEEIEVI